MRLYHGSITNIDRIDLLKSKPNKDFGKAFYLSTDYEQAMEMAQFKAEFADTEPVVNVYEFDEGCLSQLRYHRFEEYSEDWAHFVYDHRTEPQGRTLHDYDIVIGPIADDVVGYQIRRVEEGIISEEQFLEEIKFHTITMQYLFATQKATNLLQRI